MSVKKSAALLVASSAVAWWELVRSSLSGAAEPVLTGVIFGLAGGFAAAAVPWGKEPGWGLREAIKSLLLGPVGAVLAGLLLSEMQWFKNHPNAIIGSQIVAAYMAQKWLSELRAVKLRTAISWVGKRASAVAGKEEN